MREKLITIFIIGSLLGIYFVVRKDSKCPDDYATIEEVTEAMNNWTNSYFDSHPDASLMDWSNARRDYYHQNNCTEAIKRWDQAGERP